MAFFRDHQPRERLEKQPHQPLPLTSPLRSPGLSINLVLSPVLPFKEQKLGLDQKLGARSSLLLAGWKVNLAMAGGWNWILRSLPIQTSL